MKERKKERTEAEISDIFLLYSLKKEKNKVKTKERKNESYDL